MSWWMQAPLRMTRFPLSSKPSHPHSRVRRPKLVCAASAGPAGLRIVLGARPGRAVLVADGLQAGDTDWERLADGVALGTNARASQAYRRKIAPVLMERAVRACQGKEG